MTMRTAELIGRVGVLAVALGVGTAIASAAPVRADDTPTTASATDSARHARVKDRPAERVRRPGSVRQAAAVPRPATSLRPARAATADVSTSRPTASVTVTSNPLGALFNNVRPSVRPVRIGQSATGVVTGDLGVSDPDSTTVTVTVTTPPARGTVEVEASGRFTYTPDAVLAHTGYTDTFVVTATDAGSGFHIHGLAGLLNLLTFGLIGSSGHTSTATATVTVNPVNAAPVATLFLGDTEALTGVVRGAVTARDADADPLSFTVAGASKGAVSLAADGTFAYTPTAQARHSAAATGATAGDLSDAFTITVDDGHGGSVAVPVMVSVAGFNTAPTLAPQVAAPDATTGIVLVSANAADPEQDSLSYSATGAGKGTLTVGVDGTITYLPAATARHGAAALNAADAARADSFTLTVTDGHGGMVTVPVTVVIAPANTAPGGSVAVEAPDAATGVVLGVVTAADADGDVLTFTASVPGAGSVEISGGGFVYVPTATARHAAAAPGGSISDTFTVTVSDGHGAAVPVPITVAILPANTAPTGSALAGEPDAGGVVTGAVTFTDADGDALTFTASVSAKGTVRIDPDGTFTYTPTSTARHAAAALDAGLAETTDTVTVTVTDGHGGAVVTAVAVAIAPANETPTAIATVGLPDLTTGVVAGAVLGIDADSDLLTYAVSSAGKGTVVLGDGGAFTYTPTTIARHVAGLTTVMAEDLTDTFAVTVSDGFGGTVVVPVTVAIAPTGITFDFVYGSGSQYWSAGARSALLAAATNLASYIVVGAPVTVSFNVVGQSVANSGLLANMFAYYSSGTAGFHGTVAQAKVLTGVDANAGTAEGTITWNFAYPWALGDTVGGSQYDFQAVALHELLHGLGFLTGLESPTGMNRNWTTFDSFLSSADGSDVIGANYVWNSAYTANLTGANGGLYFAGPATVAIYGGPVPLYTPGTWASGTSLTHLDPDMPGGDTHVMNPFEYRGPGVRTIGPLELAILTDLGYTVSPAYAFVLIGFGLRRRRRQPPIRVRHWSRFDTL